MSFFRHKKLLHYRKIKHVCFLRKISLRITTLNNIHSQQEYFSPQMLKGLTFEQRKQLRQRNPQFPPTMFMTEDEKQDFFKQTSDRFKENLDKIQKRECKTKKIVKFLGKIQHLYDPNSQIVQNIDQEQSQ